VVSEKDDFPPGAGTGTRIAPIARFVAIVSIASREAATISGIHSEAYLMRIDGN